MSAKFGVGIDVAKTAKEVVSDARIINTITTSGSPIFSLKELSDEFRLNFAGANLPFGRKVDRDVLEGIDIIIAEHFEQAFRESAEIADYFASYGRVKIIELKDILASGRDYNIRWSVFKSTSTGREDIASAYLVLKKIGLHWD